MHKRVLIAGTGSGCGKTTVTLALLSALKKRGLAVSAFKCGPDYIDPMFHRRAVGVPSYNLDPFFCTGGQLRTALAREAGDVAVVEGVMGYYDGVGAAGAFSTFDVAKETGTPVILVVNARGMAASAGALLRGYRTFGGNSAVCGVIFNGVTPSHYELLRQLALAENVLPLGFLPQEESLVIGSRRLGLLAADEIADLREQLDRLATLAEMHLDLDGVLTLADTAAPLNDVSRAPAAKPLVRVAVARDAAFCFLYQENLDLLRELGCELVFFSPLADGALPEKIDALYLPGGYPELHVQALADNGSMREGVRAALAGGLPAIAECGGFLYLHESLDGAPMAGFVPARAFATERLRRFGYVTLTAQRDNLLCRAGESIRAHAFHYYESTDCGAGFVATRVGSGTVYPCVHATPTLYAGFPHLYLPANPIFAKNFVRKAITYANTRT